MDSPSHGWWPPQRLPATLLIHPPEKKSLFQEEPFSFFQRLLAVYYLADTAIFITALTTEIYLTYGSPFLEKALFLPLHPIPPYPPFPLPH